MNFLKKIYEFIGNVFIFFIGWFFGGIVIGLGLTFAIAFFIYGFIYATIVTVLFLPFHITDLKGLFLNKNWFGFFGRITVLYAIGSYVGGFVAFMSGLMDFPTDVFTGFVFFTLTISGWIGIIAFLIISRFYSKSTFVKNLRQSRRGLEKIGVLWF